MLFRSEWRPDAVTFDLRPCGLLSSACSSSGGGDPRITRATDFIQSLVDDGVSLLEEVMDAVTDFHAAAP